MCRWRRQSSRNSRGRIPGRTREWTQRRPQKKPQKRPRRTSLDSTDDSLIYKFVFTDSAMEGVDEKALIDALQEGVDAEDFTTTFEDIAASVKSLVPLDTVKVEVIYAKADGTELVHKTYTSK